MGNKITSNIDHDAYQLSGDIARCEDYTELEHTLFQSVAKKIGAETCALLHFHQCENGYEIDRNSALGVDNTSHNSYVQKFHRNDPVLTQRKSAVLATGKRDATTDVYRLSDVCDPNTFVRTQYYNEFLKPTGIRHVLALTVRPKSENNDLLVVVGFHRPLGMRDFGERAMQSAVSIAPVIGSTIAKLTFKENMHKYRALTQDFKSLVHDTGYLILDDILQIQDISSCVVDQKYGDLPFLMQKISSACQTLATNKDSRIAFTCLRHDKKSTQINKTINIEVSQVSTPNTRHHYVARISFVYTNVAISKCIDEFGWTSRESEIVMALAQGNTNTQIAKNLLISVRTVENHLRSIYSKADVTSRTQLLRHLLFSTPTRRINGPLALQ